MPRSWKNLPLALCLGLLTVIASQIGCSKESPTGGPAATNDANSSNSTSTNSTSTTNPPSTTDGFRLEVPSLRTALEPGIRKEVTIAIDRDGNFKDPVALTFKTPDGVTATAAKERFESNDKEIVLGLEASADAKPGEASIVLRRFVLRCFAVTKGICREEVRDIAGMERSVVAEVAPLNGAAAV